MPFVAMETPPRVVAKQERIKMGDQKASTALEPNVFEGVSERMAEMRQQPGGMRSQPYRDDPNSVSGTEKRVSITRGGGVPSSGEAEGAGKTPGGGDLLDLISMDMTGTSGEHDLCLMLGSSLLVASVMLINGFAWPVECG